MQKLRPLLTAVLGLMLWVQGLAIAAAPVEAPTDAASAMEMPCHGATAPCDCCDGDCPDMAGCVIGSFAGTPATAAPLVRVAQAHVTARGWSAKTAVLPLPLRPPIVSHA